MLPAAWSRVTMTDGPARAESRPRQKHVLLSQRHQAEIVERYEAGAFKQERARIYGITSRRCGRPSDVTRHCPDRSTRRGAATGGTLASIRPRTVGRRP